MLDWVAEEDAKGKARGRLSGEFSTPLHASGDEDDKSTASATSATGEVHVAQIAQRCARETQSSDTKVKILVREPHSCTPGPDTSAPSKQTATVTSVPGLSKQQTPKGF